MEFATPRESHYGGDGNGDPSYATPSSSSRDAGSGGGRAGGHKSRTRSRSANTWGEVARSGRDAAGDRSGEPPDDDDALNSARSSQYYTDSSVGDYQSGGSDSEGDLDLNTARSVGYDLSGQFNGLSVNGGDGGRGGASIQGRGRGNAGVEETREGGVGGGGGRERRGGGGGGAPVDGGGTGGGMGGGDFSEEEVREAFAAFDEDGDGLLDVNDVQSFFEVLGESLTVYEVSELIRMVDGNRDGKVNFDEFFDLATRSAQFFETR